MSNEDRAPQKAKWLVVEAWMLGLIIVAGYIGFGWGAWAWLS